MHVLICDDDKATRFAVKRILVEHLGCRTTECEDGVEALHLIAKERFSFILLDIEMPTMSGIEVLELLRESPDTQTLPVVILSNIRDEKTIRHLLQLGVADYVLKPPRAEKLVTKLQRLVKVIPASEQVVGDSSRICLSQNTPAMLIDGNLDYRYFFVTQAQRYGPIQEVDSGAAAVARFRDSPAQLVFIGGDLGVVGPESLAKRLRQMRPDAPPRLVGILDDKAPAALQSAFDSVIPRSLVPDRFRASLRPFVHLPGPLSAFAQVVHDLPALATSASQQVFGMMFDADVTTREVGTSVSATACATIPIQANERFAVAVGIFMDTPAATAVAVKMFGAAADEVTDEDRDSVASEISNLVSGRIHANFKERGLPSVAGLPAPVPAGQVPVPPMESGFLSGFAIDGAGEFFVSVRVHDASAEAAVPSPDGTPASAASAPGTATDGQPDAAPPPTPEPPSDATGSAGAV